MDVGPAILKVYRQEKGSRPFLGEEMVRHQRHRSDLYGCATRWEWRWLPRFAPLCPGCYATRFAGSFDVSGWRRRDPYSLGGIAT